MKKKFGSSLFDLVDENKREFHDYTLRFGKEEKKKHEQSSRVTRQQRFLHTPQNLNPIVFDDYHVGDVSKLIKNSKALDENILKRELRFEMLQNPNYAADLLETYETKYKNEISFQNFLSKELERLMKRGRKRNEDISSSLEYLRDYYVDENDLHRNTQQQTSKYGLGYQMYRKKRFNERVMSIFKGKEELFEDPFGMGLEPSIHAYHPQHFYNVVFNPSDEYFERKSTTTPRTKTQTQIGQPTSSKLFYFLQSFQK